MKLANLFDALVGRLPEDMRESVMSVAQEEVESAVKAGNLPDEAIFQVIQGVTEVMAEEQATNKLSEWQKNFTEKELPGIIAAKFDALAAERLGTKIKSGDQNPGAPPDEELTGDEEEAERILNSNTSSVAEKQKAFRQLYGFDLPAS
mgnify:FL=1